MPLTYYSRVGPIDRMLLTVNGSQCGKLGCRAARTAVIKANQLTGCCSITVKAFALALLSSEKGDPYFDRAEGISNMGTPDEPDAECVVHTLHKTPCAPLWIKVVMSIEQNNECIQ